MKLVTGRPKNGLLDYIAIIAHVSSPFLCFMLSFASLIALDPPTNEFLFGNCNLLNYK